MLGIEAATSLKQSKQMIGWVPMWFSSAQGHTIASRQQGMSFRHTSSLSAIHLTFLNQSQLDLSCVDWSLDWTRFPLKVLCHIEIRLPCAWVQRGSNLDGRWEITCAPAESFSTQDRAPRPLHKLQSDLGTMYSKMLYTGNNNHISSSKLKWWQDVESQNKNCDRGSFHDCWDIWIK